MKNVLRIFFVLFIGACFLCGCADKDEKALTETTETEKMVNSIIEDTESENSQTANLDTDETELPVVNQTTKPQITTKESKVRLRKWLDEHPFQFPAFIESDDNVQTVSERGSLVQGEEFNLGDENYYLFYVGIERFGVVEILVNQETGDLFHFTSPGNDIFEPIDAWYEREHMNFDDENNSDDFEMLSDIEAWEIAEDWIKEHPDMTTPYEQTSISGMADEVYIRDGEEYYHFYLNGYYWVEILVQSKTGELWCLVSEESDDLVEPQFVKLDDYYNEFY